MNRDMMVHVTPFEVHVAILEDSVLVEYHVERKRERNILGNVYKGRVEKVLPGMQSAFVDIGLEKNGFLYVTDFLEEFSELADTMDDDGRPTGASQNVLEAAPPPARRRQGRGTTPADDEPDGAPDVVDESAIPFDDDLAHPGYLDEEIQFLADSEAEVLGEGGEAPAAREGAAGQTQASAGRARHDRGRQGTPTTRPTPRSRAQPKADSPSKRALDAFSLSAETEASSTLRESSAAIPVSDRSVPHSADRRGRGRDRRGKGRNYGNVGENETGNISTMLKQGQEIIVQVVKEPISLKSARITSHVSLPGRTLVYLPTFNRIGVSRKIHSDGERKRLRSILSSNLKQGQGGFIIRTASDGCSDTDLLQDMNYLLNTWKSVQERAVEAPSPSVLYEEPDITARLLRDKLDESMQSIWVDDETAFAEILGFVERFQPKSLSRVKLFNKEDNIFEYFNLMSEIQKAIQPKVWLRSGGFIVINHAEALVAIDVNTGRYVGRNATFEETITKINVDASKEIARQIRLRNLGGIIVIDFIDMSEKKNRKTVMDSFMLEIRRDKEPSNVLPINEFGLVIMTRKRTSSALEKNLSESCPYCEGNGFIRSISSVCYDIYSTVERMRTSLKNGTTVIRANPEVVKALKAGERQVVDEIRKLTGQDVVFVPEALFLPHAYDVTSQ